MQSNFFISSSILRKFLIFNLVIFLFLGIFTFLYLNNLDVFSSNTRSVEFSKVEDQNSEYFDIELAAGTDEEEIENELELDDTKEDTVHEKNNDFQFNLKGLFDSVANQVNSKSIFKNQE